MNCSYILYATIHRQVQMTVLFSFKSTHPYCRSPQPEFSVVVASIDLALSNILSGVLANTSFSNFCPIFDLLAALGLILPESGIPLASRSDHSFFSLTVVHLVRSVPCGTAAFSHDLYSRHILGFPYMYNIYMHWIIQVARYCQSMILSQ